VIDFENRKPFYATPEWTSLRERVVLRDGARCRNCGDPERLEVHHWLPEHEHSGDHDASGYGLGPNPLLVHESGLVTLCHDCHVALTSIRVDRSLERDPRTEASKKNIFQLWALANEQVPFKAVKETWAGRKGQFMVIENVEIKKWPYGSAWGRYCNGKEVGEHQKIANAGTYTWTFYRHDDVT
jgi:5-methylcytosine-specific restriction endonuclease McrA